MMWGYEGVMGRGSFRYGWEVGGEGRWVCQGRLCVEGVSEQTPEDDEESAMWRQRGVSQAVRTINAKASRWEQSCQSEGQKGGC